MARHQGTLVDWFDGWVIEAPFLSRALTTVILRRSHRLKGRIKRLSCSREISTPLTDKQLPDRRKSLDSGIEKQE